MDELRFKFLFYGVVGPVSVWPVGNYHYFEHALTTCNISIYLNILFTIAWSMKSGEVKDGCTLDPDQLKNLKKKISKIPDDTVLQEEADFIKALADPTRLKIIHLLGQGELCVCEIFTCLKKPQPTVSHHLNILKKAGCIKSRKEGVWIHYSLANPQIMKILEGLSVP